mgnify:CR=1 FL=1
MSTASTVSTLAQLAADARARASQIREGASAGKVETPQPNTRSLQTREYPAYLQAWRAQHARDMPEIAPPDVGPPERAEVWGAFWDAMASRNARYRDG